MKLFLFIIAAVLISVMITAVLISSCMEDSSEYHARYKSQLVDKISYPVLKQLKQEKNLYPCECGGRMMNQITLLHWAFDYYKEIDIAEGRELLLEVEKRMLKAFNEDERIRPYLATYPFKPENIEIRIFLHNSNGSELGPGKLHVAKTLQGEFEYMVQNSDTIHLDTILIETHEQAEAGLGAISL